ncbi:MAG: hypothetical protein GEU98_02350 [Pseudonocardiaceae bacterium]|nr:hypothetical protein [Pseudonocardiaceae bacterium]
MSSPARSTALPRTADAVRRVLAEHRPDLHERFVAEFHTAMAETDDDFDTERLTRLVGRWWAQAMVLLDPDPEVDAAHARISAGDPRDLTKKWCPQPDGSQHVYHRTGDGGWAFARVMSASA